MILYNVTISIDPEVHQEWLAWMKEVHIPDVLKTGMFRENKIEDIIPKVVRSSKYINIFTLSPEM